MTSRARCRCRGEQVVLDVSVVIDQVKQRLVDRGLTIVQNVPIPDSDRQIVLLEAPQVKQLRTIYSFASWTRRACSGSGPGPRCRGGSERLVDLLPHAQSVLFDGCRHLAPPHRVAQLQLADELTKLWGRG